MLATLGWFLLYSILSIAPSFCPVPVRRMFQGFAGSEDKVWHALNPLLPWQRLAVIGGADMPEKLSSSNDKSCLKRRKEGLRLCWLVVGSHRIWQGIGR